jgi:hypothetical protein
MSEIEQNGALAELEQRLKVIRDRVRGVALRQHTGFYLFGRAGTSKTHTVRTTLEEMGSQYAYQSGHLTDLGLFDLLAENNDRIVLLDDVSAIFKQKIGLQILLAALGNQPSDRGTRIIKYRRRGCDETIRFTGGIIAISNLELHAEPVLAALKSRVTYLKYDPTDQQVEALMLKIANKGWTTYVGSMSAQECRDVAEYLISESHRLSVRLDMRNLVDKAFPDYLQHRTGMTETHWKDLIRTTLEEQLVELKHTPEMDSRDSKKRREQIIARSLVAEYPDRMTRAAKWVEVTGKSERAFYRRLQEIDGLTV